MMKLIYIFLLLLLGACDQNSNHSPMLWQITGKQLKEPSYIFGTFHTKDPKLNILPDSVLLSLKSSHRLYTEIPMSDKSTKEVIFFSKMVHPTDLNKRLHPKTIKLLLNHLKKYKFPYTLKSLRPFKTWAIGLMLVNQKENSKYPNTLFMDEKIVEVAKTKNIKQSALEKPIEQLKYFDRLSSSDQEQFLLDTFIQQENTGYADALKNWYTEGNAEGFFILQERYASENKKQKKLDDILIQGLLIERNHHFTRRIDILLQNKPELKYFFAIGAGHMSGDKSIIQRLKKLGYTINKI